MAQGDVEGKNVEYKKAAQSLMQVSFSRTFGHAKMLVSRGGRSVTESHP